MTRSTLPSETLEQIATFSTCVVDSAIETFGTRLRNTGFADSRVRCIFEEHPPIVGYAATARIRSSEPPMAGRAYYDRTDWWSHVLSIPGPRVVVIEDMDRKPGLGAFVGQVHANILLALGCVGLVTNGGVRDLPEIRATGFQLFAGNVSVSHAYAHVFDFGGTVTVGDLTIKPSDLVHADLHGVQTIPIELAEKIPPVVRQIQEKRAKLAELCGSGSFTIAKLHEAVRENKP